MVYHGISPELLVFSRKGERVYHTVQRNRPNFLKKNYEKKSFKNLRTSKYFITKNKTIILISKKSFKKLS